MSVLDKFPTSEPNTMPEAGTHAEHDGHHVAQTSVPHIGAMVGGRYRVTCRLAEGTFGHTYLAKDMHLPDCPECVIKQLKPQIDEKAMQMARRLFETEARVLYELGSHDQIPQLLAHFEQNGEFFLAQEFVDGYPIAEEFSPDRPWPEVHVVCLLEEVLEVLAFVHSKRVIHRDIKPGNLIRRNRDGKIVLIDFGAVKEVTTRFLTPRPGETDYTVAIGTVGYIPKEQLGGRPRFSSDVYAVGMLGIQALTGIHPNELVEDDHTAELHWRDRLLSPIHPDLADIIDRMVRYDFRDRHPHAEAALKALQTLPIELRTPPYTPPPWRMNKRTALHASLPPTLPPTQPFGSEPSAEQTPTSPPQPPTPVSSLGKQDASSVRMGNSGHTQRTNVVAPAFAGSDSGEANRSSDQDLANPGDYFMSLRSAVLPFNLGRMQRTFSSASTSLQDWMSRSWLMVLMLGATSFSLMVARGVASSSSFNPSPYLQATIHKEDILPKAEQLMQGTASVEEAITPTVQAIRLLNQAALAREDGQDDVAMTLYREAITLDSKLADAHAGRCDIYLSQGNLEQATNACHDAIAIDSDHAEALWNLSKIYEQTGSYDLAAEIRNRALALDLVKPESSTPSSSTPQ